MTAKYPRRTIALGPPYDDGTVPGVPMTTTPSTLSRWELLQDDPRFGLSKGDVLICESMHWAWADEKIAVLRRESDGYEPGCSMYRHMVRHLSGPTLGHVHARDDR